MRFNSDLHEDSLTIPYSWKHQKVVFVNSMSDLFHKNVAPTFIQKVFNVMNENPHHTFQILTKRADLLFEIHDQLKWGHNIWMGVSVENQKFISRTQHLRETNARIKFLSCEPLIGPLKDITLDGIDWVIVGGESGRKARPMEVDWVLDITATMYNSRCCIFF